MEINKGSNLPCSFAAQFACAIWLAVPAVALRTEGDKRPVQLWASQAEQESQRRGGSCPSGLPTAVVAALGLRASRPSGHAERKVIPPTNPNDPKKLPQNPSPARSPSW